MASKLSSLCDWMEQVGITWDKNLVTIVDSSAGCSGLALGVVAASYIAEGHSLCVIPKSACISIRNTPISDLIEKEELGGGLGLVLAVLHEMSLREESKWFDYLQALPAREYLPVFWSIEEEELLTGTEAQDKPQVDRSLTQDDFEEDVLPLLDRYPGRLKAEFITLDNFRVAASYVASRAFGIDDYHGDAMVPLADIFNHKVSVVELAPGYEVHGAEGGSSEDDEHDHNTADSSNAEHAGHADSSDEGAVRAGRCAKGGASTGALQPNGGVEPQIGDVPGKGEEPPGKSSTAQGRALVQANVEDEGGKLHGIYGIHSANGLHLRLEIAILDKDDHLEIVAASAVPKGAEVHNTYGEHGNSELVYKYGFALRENPFTAVTISKDEVLAAARRELGSKAFKDRSRFLEDETDVLDPQEEPFEVLANGHISPALFVALRVFGAEASEAKQWGGISEALRIPIPQFQEAPSPSQGADKPTDSSKGAEWSPEGAQVQCAVGSSGSDVAEGCRKGCCEGNVVSEDAAVEEKEDTHIPAVQMWDVRAAAGGAKAQTSQEMEHSSLAKDTQEPNASSAHAQATTALGAKEHRAVWLASLLTQRACAILLQAVQHRLEQYDTSLAADRELWQSPAQHAGHAGTLNEHQAAVAAALLLRLSEKEVLTEMLQAIAMRKEALHAQQALQEQPDGAKHTKQPSRQKALVGQQGRLSKRQRR